MAKCEYLEKCLFFFDTMEAMPNMAKVIKDKYCQNNNSRCARFIIFSKSTKDPVPTNLFPHQHAKVKSILDT